MMLCFSMNLNDVVDVIEKVVVVMLEVGVFIGELFFFDKCS